MALAHRDGYARLARGHFPSIRSFLTVVISELDAVDRALLACMVSDPDADSRALLRSLSCSNWETLLERANGQKIGPLVYGQIKSLGLEHNVPAQVNRALRQRYRDNGVRNLRHQAALSSIITAFDEVGIPVILLKGAYLVTRAYDDIALREMNDLDVLVHQRDLKRGLGILEQMGFRPMKEPAQAATVAKHAPFLLGLDVGVDLHRTILSTEDEVDPLDVDGLWDRAVPAQVAGVPTWALCHEDLLLHACTHAAYEHDFAFGLRPFCDIDRIARRWGDEIRWQAFIDRAGEWGRQRGVQLSLLLAKELLGTPLPDHVAAALAPRLPDAEVIATATELIFADPYSARSMQVNIMRWQEASARERARLLYERLRWHPEASQASIGYYARRFKTLVARHSWQLFRLLLGHTPTQRLAEHKRALATWLADDDAPARRQ